MKFIDVVQFRVNGFNFGMYTVKMALSCRNMSDRSEVVPCIVSAFI